MSCRHLAATHRAAQPEAVTAPSATRDGAVLADDIEQLDLAAWTLKDARAWWREFPK